MHAQLPALPQAHPHLLAHLAALCPCRERDLQPPGVSSFHLLAVTFLLVLGCLGTGCGLPTPSFTEEEIHKQFNDSDLDDWPACTEANVGKPCDCDDTRQGVYPGADEVCDVLDNDCDGQVDEGLPSYTFYLDKDADGYGAAAWPLQACARPAWYVLSSEDCDDERADAYPGADEACNGTDDDCDGEIDDGLEFTHRWPDADGDGFGDEASTPTYTCERAEGFSSLGGDCNDALANVHPGADELCSSTADTNCDDKVGHQDNDEDGWEPCEASSGEPSDCNDGDQTIHPGALEICEDPALDNDCDGDTNDAPAQTWYQDEDGDGYGGEERNNLLFQEGCSNDGYVLRAGDCDNQDPAIHPGALEVCNGIDDDCDFEIDEDSDSIAWYPDQDRDGYGDAQASPTYACSQPEGLVSNAGDCDDLDKRQHPGAEESCTQAEDLNCDGSLGSQDGDLDGVDACEDCNDDPSTGATSYPGATEQCNGMDDDCNGIIDDVGTGSWYRDADHDGYGTGSPVTMYGCNISGWSTRGAGDEQDCNDKDAAIHPEALERCNGLDDDCDADIPASESDQDGDGMRACPTSSLPADCNDGLADVFPGAPELCDRLDNDCDGAIDEDPTLTWWPDYDGDGYGSPAEVRTQCERPPSFVLAEGGVDCDDTNPSIHPSVSEVCDPADRDENCNGVADNTDTGADYASRVPAYTDQDGDGYGSGVVTWVCDLSSVQVSTGGDCNDTDPRYYPGAPEVCDTSSPDFGSDFNCDGTTASQDADRDGFPACQDCDDRSAALNPDAAERCNGLDDDCDGAVDDRDSDLVDGQAWYPDADRDGSGDAASSSTLACTTPPGNGTPWQQNNLDCNDQNAAVHPGAPERCTTDFDDDCDGEVNEPDAADAQPYFRDNDGDGYGNPATALTSCAASVEGYVTQAGDCDDQAADTHPGAQEVCDTREQDEDCSGAADDLDLSVDPSTRTPWYPDRDLDGLGDRYDNGILYCDPPTGYVADHSDCNDDSDEVGAAVNGECPLPSSTCGSGGDLEDHDGDGFPACNDCNDADTSVHPGAAEQCNALDDDCDQVTDEGVKQTYYLDQDADGYGTLSSIQQACSAPVSYVLPSGDCNDVDPSAYPGAEELCDLVDNNCDGKTDETLGTSTWFRDADRDGYGDPRVQTISCADLQPAYVLNDQDCNDASAAIHPGISETCNQVDDDCNGSVDDGIPSTTWYEDADRDGYGSSSVFVPRCSQPAGYVPDSGDCNDGNSNIHPDADEQCNFSDDDCDQLVDEGLPAQTWSYDWDRDGYGDPNTPRTACQQPAGYVASADDCDDTRADTHPNATEKCDALDNNCDGDIDEGHACECRVGPDPASYPYTTVQSAIDAFERGEMDCDDETVWVAEGTYNQPLSINSSVKLRSEAGPELTILTANGKSQSVLVFGALSDAVVEGFTIQGGKGNTTCDGHSGYSCGGGAYIGGGGRALLTDNTFYGNSAGYGGAVYAGRCPSGICSEVQLIDNRIGPLPNPDGSCPSTQQNSASWYGSGIYLEGGAILSMHSNVLSCNKDGSSQLYLTGISGAVLESDVIQKGTSYGIYLTGSSARLSGVTVDANTYTGIYGSSSTIALEDSMVRGNKNGGLRSLDSTVTVDRSVFTGNSSGSGGGIYGERSTLTLRDSTFTGNVASGEGGAIYAYCGDSNQEFTLERSITSNNRATKGAAIYLEGNSYNGRTLLGKIHNSIFLNNSATSGEGGILYLYDKAVLDLQGSLFYSNDLSTNSGASVGAIKLRYRSTGTIAHNTFVDTRLVAGSKACEIYGAESGTSLSLWDNLLVGRGDGLGVCADSGVAVTRLSENAISGYWDELGLSLAQTTFPSGNTLDPSFVSRPADLDWCYADLHLRDDSPYLDSSLEDLDGDGQPDGNEYGAFGGTYGDWEPSDEGCE